LIHPLANLLPGAFGKGGKAQSTRLSRFVGPDQLARRFHTLIQIKRNPKSDDPRLHHGSDGMKGQATLRNIQNNRATIRFEVDVNELRESQARRLTPLVDGGRHG
jgi:hypothetical protein